MMILMATTRLEYPTIPIETKILDEYYAKMEACRVASGGYLLCSLEMASILRNAFDSVWYIGARTELLGLSSPSFGVGCYLLADQRRCGNGLTSLHMSCTRCNFLIPKTTDFSRLS